MANGQTEQEPLFAEDYLRIMSSTLQQGGILVKDSYVALENAAQELERFRELLNLWLSLSLWTDDMEGDPPSESELVDDTLWAVSPDELPDEVEQELYDG